MAKKYFGSQHATAHINLYFSYVDLYIAFCPFIPLLKYHAIFPLSFALCHKLVPFGHSAEMGEPESNKEYPDQTIVEVREYSICTSGISKAKQEMWSLNVVYFVEAVEHRPIMFGKDS